MLEKIIIKNYVLFDDVEIDFQNGFNVLVGQTGAGKSLILSSMKFALGGKTDKSVIRNGESCAKVTLCFLLKKELIPLLESIGVSVDDESLIISRTLRQDGKNEYRINGEIVTLSSLKILSDALVDFHYQNESIELLNQKNHLTMLDSFCGKDIDSLKQDIQVLKQKLEEVRQKIKEIGENEYDRERQISLFQYQIDEINNANLQEDEENDIQDKLKIAINSEKISKSLSTSIDYLSSEKAGLSLIKYSISELHKLNGLNEDIDKCCARLESTRYELEDIVSELGNLDSLTYFDSNEIDSLYRRLDEIKLLKKKYGNSLEEITKFCDEAQSKLDLLINANEILESLKSERAKLSKQLYGYCEKLTKVRTQQSKKFEESILSELRSLSMKDAKFVVDIKPLKEYDENFICDENGNDRVEFMFSANLGQSLQPIIKSISGGEMSRFMLGLKSILVDMYTPSLLVLDEVDTGISGEVGTYVAQKIAKISKSTQVICITHMPQVTAMADRYIYISKINDNNLTTSKASLLTDKEQIEYISKLFSMTDTTNSSNESAKELKEWCNNYKQTLMNN